MTVWLTLLGSFYPLLGNAGSYLRVGSYPTLGNAGSYLRVGFCPTLGSVGSYAADEGCGGTAGVGLVSESALVAVLALEVVDFELVAAANGAKAEFV